MGENGKLRIVEWAMANGLPPEGFVDMGFLERHRIPAVLAECHAAIFPNRCEGATNLVAMEAMACGVPVILSANTGHLDLIQDGNCLPLRRQSAVADPTGRRRHWGESSVEEAVELLETLYTDRAAARSRAEAAQAFLRGERTWRAFAEAFVAAVA
ncbi:glycosyltransferase [Azospirillum isscasi]|uniref:Glycosyltransferase n=1 Tax=Azospirillum isscasi TaxID=3053926 RepID=A0ABU0WDQ9_9PROT|nr:glycosyltransferase [Azospirillum isscasi]MDQ2101734.1 glycosyltransferase [Azospirillum isscasi]